MKNIIFVSDLFVDDYVGGAELTTEAIIQQKPEEYNVIKVRSNSVNTNLIEEHKNDIWVFGNFYLIDNLLLLDIAKKIKKYYVIEYDFKFCLFRSKIVHESNTGQQCDCGESQRGKIIFLFLTKSTAVFWMSQKQFEIQKELFPAIEKTSNVVISSVFSDRDIGYIDELRKVTKNKNNKFIILQSSSPVKNTVGCIEYANKNNLEYETVGNLPYFQLLRKLANSKGLIFLPSAEDTCPRIVIEAKLLNCSLIMNDNVLHSQEQWFNEPHEKIIKYLQNNANFFWDHIGNK